jgi:predicted 2-oxoglutarate/Fe(II)-dependent dioxygenase YbiX
MDKLLYKEGFLPLETCNKYRDWLKSTDKWENNGDGVWNRRSINLHSMDPDLREEMLDLRIRVKQEIINFLQITQPIYADIFQFVRWHTGNELHPHADAENSDGSPHPFPWRNFASIIYVNDEYKGGQTYFPNFNNYAPGIKPGTLVVFPGTLEYLHGVTKVTEGTRYTIASFWTYDEKKKDAYRI